MAMEVVLYLHMVSNQGKTRFQIRAVHEGSCNSTGINSTLTIRPGRPAASFIAVIHTRDGPQNGPRGTPLGLANYRPIVARGSGWWSV